MFILKILIPLESQEQRPEGGSGWHFLVIIILLFSIICLLSNDTTDWAEVFIKAADFHTVFGPVNVIILKHREFVVEITSYLDFFWKGCVAL